MKQCKRCYSCAINDHLHGRDPGVDLDLCDVCYWRFRSEAWEKHASDAMRRARLAEDKCTNLDAIILDCWNQFAIDVTVNGEEWQSDGALSTLEDVADYLEASGYLLRHPTMQVYRIQP